MLPKKLRIAVSDLLIRRSRWPRIYLQEMISFEPRMNMNVEVRNLLEGGFADGMPKTETLVRKRGRNCACDLCEGLHQRRSGVGGKLANVGHMFFRYDERMAGMKLPEIDECHGEVVVVDDAGRQPASDDLTEYTGRLSAH